MIRIIAIILIVLGIITAGVGAYLAPDDLSRCGVSPSTNQGCQKADAIVAVSGGYTSVRAKEAIELYKQGWAKRLIFSGAAYDGNGPSNALVMRKQAEAAGVPSDDISIDETARTTHQNAQRTNNIFKYYDIRSIILVTSPYHQRRASIEFKALAGSSEQVRSHPAKNDPDWPWYWWITPRGWWLAGGELVKIVATHAGESR